jgi:chromosome segregation ATPase
MGGSSFVIKDMQ